jgi:hypothetical protein
VFCHEFIKSSLYFTARQCLFGSRIRRDGREADEKSGASQ